MLIREAGADNIGRVPIEHSQVQAGDAYDWIA